MKACFILLKFYSKSLFGINRLIHTRDKAQKSKGISSLIGFSVLGVMMFAMSASYFLGMGSVFHAIGRMDLLLAIGVMATAAIILLTTTFSAGTILFGFKDFDLLYSLPISAKALVMSRVITLYAYDLFFTIFLMVPACGVYAYFAHPAWYYYPLALAVTFLAPVLPVILAAAIGTLISIASVHFKYKTMVSTVLGIAFVVIIMIFSFNSNSVIENFEQIGPAVGAAVMRVYPPAYWLATGLAKGNIPLLVLFAGVNLLGFWVLAALVGKVFKQVNTRLTAVATRRAAALPQQAAAESSPYKALYRKELRRFFSSSLYVMNAGIGAVMMTLACVAFTVAGVEKAQAFLEMQNLQEIIVPIAPFALALIAAFNCTTSCSISLEGKNIWMLKSLPIRSQDLFKAKAMVNLTIMVPAIILNATILSFALKPSIETIALLYLLPIACSALVSYLGLVINLALPKLDWKQEVQAIKQGASVVLTLFCSMAIAVIPLIVAVSAIGHATTIGVISFVVFVLLTRLLARYLSSKGLKKLIALES